MDFSQHPLIIRAAEGAQVVFDGSRPVERFQPHEELPGVFWIDYTSGGAEYPKLWEPHTRMRYRLVADHQTVARFPATYTVEGKRLLFHTSDGQAPDSGGLLMGAHDFVTGNDNVVRRCTAEDVGGGVYVGGRNAVV